MGFTLKGSSVCKLLAGCSLGVVMALLAPSLASADGLQGRYVVDASSLYVRAKGKNSFALGTLFKGDHMDVYYINPRNWAWGYAYGTYEGCGWVLVAGKKKVDQRGVLTAKQYIQKREADQKNFEVKCGKPTYFKLSSFGFALGKRGSGPNGKDGSDAYMNDCPSKGYYGNYRGGKFRHKLGKLEKNAKLLYRYTARNSDGSKPKAALVRRYGRPGWFFVRRACVSYGKPPK
jgi:hypothetical protein